MSTRTLMHLIRFIVGVVFIILFFKFLGITWADVDNFLDNGLLRSLDVLKELKGVLAQ